MLLALFACGSFAISVPKYEHIKSMVEDDNSFFGGKKWVVLVSGSRGWYNYRHQVTKNLLQTFNYNMTVNILVVDCANIFTYLLFYL